LEELEEIQNEKEKIDAELKGLLKYIKEKVIFEFTPKENDIITNLLNDNLKAGESKSDAPKKDDNNDDNDIEPTTDVKTLFENKTAMGYKKGNMPIVKYAVEQYAKNDDGSVDYPAVEAIMSKLYTSSTKNYPLGFPDKLKGSSNKGVSFDDYIVKLVDYLKKDYPIEVYRRKAVKDTKLGSEALVASQQIIKEADEVGQAIAQAKADESSKPYEKETQILINTLEDEEFKTKYENLLSLTTNVKSPDAYYDAMQSAVQKNESDVFKKIFKSYVFLRVNKLITEPTKLESYAKSFINIKEIYNTYKLEQNKVAWENVRGASKSAGSRIKAYVESQAFEDILNENISKLK
jgi:hypothetical protein